MSWLWQPTWLHLYFFHRMDQKQFFIKGLLAINPKGFYRVLVDEMLILKTIFLGRNNLIGAINLR